ncbi:hypothetical protein TASIC1_0010017600 [Trichoderma asperellum]|uniref:Uncharacterized protein n=1 Tax=Trichoderma asperellum TaxID=101201 RepID=A0A6V8R2F5_TRIAP|nr:hypothetical protein TASIC1_0010017600 [Trichoderma asperellum]
MTAEQNGPPFHRCTIQWLAIPQRRCQARGIALPIARQAQINGARPTTLPSRSAKDRQRVGDNQYRQQDACPARATHGAWPGPSKTLGGCELQPAMSGSGITDAISPAGRANGSRARRPSLVRGLDPRQYGKPWDVAHTPAPWPRFLSPRDVRYALAALDGTAWPTYLLVLS